MIFEERIGRKNEYNRYFCKKKTKFLFVHAAFLTAISSYISEKIVNAACMHLANE